jgi:NADPH:quinone reductase-like Zn-dependent oxidoreductase
MKAFAIRRYKAPMEMMELPRPEPGAGELLVRVRAASVNPLDYKIRDGAVKVLLSFSFPLILGTDLAGDVEAIGPSVTKFELGDAVYSRLDNDRIGAFAEYALVRESAAARKPARLDYTQAASLPLVGLTAWQALIELAQLRAGQKVLIHAGSGGVGTVAIQIARTLGARVTSVSSARNRDFCRALGADEALAYDEDRPFAAPRAYRAVFDAYGNRSYAEVRPALARGGTYVTTVPSARLFGNMLALRRARLVVVRRRRADLDRLASLVVEGKVRPVIEEVFPFHRVHDAFRRLESRRARGKLVVTID